MAITKIGTPELFNFSSLNTALQLPTGDTASRPSNPSTGEWRYNTTLKYVEYWDGGDWRQIDTEALPSSDDFPSQNFNVNTYFGNGATQTIDAKFNEAANFNGSSSKIDLPNLGISGAATRTISAWINVNSLSAAQTIFQFGDAAAGERFGFAIDTAGKVYVEYYGRDAITDSTHITINTWFHVAVTYNGGAIETPENTQIYVNGSAVDMTETGSQTGAANTADSNYGIGYRRPSTSQYFNGKIDQVRIFNTALPATGTASVATLYAETTTTAATLDFPVGAGCIAAYQLDGDASDLSNNYPGAAFNIDYTGLKFAPDFVWVKNRTDSSTQNLLTDTVRGIGSLGGANILYSDSTEVESTNADTGFLSSFDTNGFTVGNNAIYNNSGKKFVAWCWKAGGAPDATNGNSAGVAPTLGSVMIDGVKSTAALSGTAAITKLSANTQAGFSIVQFTHASLNPFTYDHGLAAEPQLIIIKSTNLVDNWYVYSQELGNTYRLSLDTTGDAFSPTGVWGSTDPTPTVFTIDNQTAGNYIAYCFRSVDGYSRISKYTGNGSEYGPIVYTTSDGTATGTDGFEPAFIMVKCTNFGGNTDWTIFDNKRSPGTGNKRRFYLYANSNTDEGNATSLEMNFYSNGFQPIGVDGTHNANGKNYLFLAIATDPYTTTPTVTNSFGITLNDAPANDQPVATTFRPDQTWIKAYNVGSGNPVAWGQYDLLRGSGVTLQSNNTGNETDYYYHYTGNILAMEFSDNGYITPPSVNNNINNTSDDYISYFWKLGGTQTINNAGAVTSVVTANVDAGTSMALWTGEGSASNIGHGLGGIPELYIVKSVTGTNSWVVGSPSIPGSGAGGYLVLNDTAEYSTSDIWGTQPDATKFYFNTAANGNGHQLGNTYISYFFRSIAGYQKVGTYTWNGTNYTAGTMVTGLGFTPRFVMIKAITEDANWFVFDSERGATTGTQQRYALYTNKEDFGGQSTAGSQGIGFDAYTGPGTGGFSAIVGADGTTTASGGLNKNGEDYIYLAIK